MSAIRFVAIGDSFTEGVGDELPDGTVLGWVELADQGWAAAAGEPISYANLAIRGKLVRPIVEGSSNRRSLSVRRTCRSTVAAISYSCIPTRLLGGEGRIFL